MSPQLISFLFNERSPQEHHLPFELLGMRGHLAECRFWLGHSYVIAGDAGAP